ncbi:MAG: F0F1 ATP synthase subunit A [Actinomycetota bacterium]|nr:F0F1 ATP synthase subunit A [Actinomycetota bacterium]
MSHPESVSPMTQMFEEFDLTTEHAQHFFGIDLRPLNKLLAQLPLPFDISVNKAVVVLWLAALLSFGLIFYAGRGRGLVAKGLRNAIEALFQFVKTDIVEDNMGHEGRKWLPFIGGLFFFILFSNLLGLIPGSFSPTSNINVTATLAILVFFSIIIQGMIKQGGFGFWKNLAPSGLPAWLYIIMYPLEFVSLLAKPFSLAVRLFANLLAGHIVILSLLSLGILAGSWLVKPVPVFAATVMYGFEIFVAFIQAYIFAILTALYIGTAIHPEH